MLHRPLSPDIDPEPASAGGDFQEESPLAAGRLWPRPPEAVGSPVAPHPKDGARDTKQERQDGQEDQDNVEESSQRWLMIPRADGISRERGAIQLRGSLVTREASIDPGHRPRHRRTDCPAQSCSPEAAAAVFSPASVPRRRGAAGGWRSRSACRRRPRGRRRPARRRGPASWRGRSGNAASPRDASGNSEEKEYYVAPAATSWLSCRPAPEPEPQEDEPGGDRTDGESDAPVVVEAEPVRPEPVRRRETDDRRDREEYLSC